MRFFPYTTAAFISTFLIYRIGISYASGEQLGWKKILSWLSGDLWEILLVDMIGLNDGSASLNAPVWTLSAMLLTEFLIIACLTYSEDKFCNLIAPISMMVGFGMWRQAESAHPKLWVYFTTYGMIRVFVISCLAYYCWRFYKGLKCSRFTKKGMIFLTVCYIATIGIMYYFSSCNFYWVATLLMLPAIAITLSEKSYTMQWIKSSKLTVWLGELSFSIFLTHYQLLYLFMYLFPEPYEMYDHIAIFMICTFVLAILFHFVMKVVMAIGLKLYSAGKNKLMISC